MDANHAGLPIFWITFLPYVLKALAIVFGYNDEVRLVSASPEGMHEAPVGVGQSCTIASAVVTCRCGRIGILLGSKKVSLHTCQ
jgi:hypothetical protein